MSWDGALSSVLSFVAIVIGIVLAALALRQSGQIARGQATQETESYLSGRMQGLVEHARETMLESQTILDLTNPLMGELLSAPEGDRDAINERRSAVVGALSRLQVHVELLRIYAITMPAVGRNDSSARTALADLMDEGAWLYSEAMHLSILAFEESPLDDVDLSDNESVIGELLNGSLVNLPRRLLSDLDGKDPNDVPFFSEPGSPWPAIYSRREDVLRRGVVREGSGPRDSLTEAAASSLAHTSERYQGFLMAVLRQWNSLRLDKTTHPTSQAGR